MSPTTPKNPIALLNPISDEDAVREVSQQTWAELAEAIVATPPRPLRRPARPESRLHTRRPVLSLAVGVAVVTALLVGVTGVLSGQAPTGAPQADAAILRGATAALHPSGSIVIETRSNVQVSDPAHEGFRAGYKPTHGVQTVARAGARSPKLRPAMVHKARSSWTWAAVPLTECSPAMSTGTTNSMTRPRTSPTSPAITPPTSLQGPNQARTSTRPRP